MNTQSFLPEDYLAQRADRRTNVISLLLFGVVMIAVLGAFFWTNREARRVKVLQQSINDQYQQAGMRIQELSQVEQQREEMLYKAELAAALVERVPRSILLAELINRMPERLALLSFDLKSEKLKPPAPPVQKDAKGRLVAPGSQRAQTKQEATEKTDKGKIHPPLYKVELFMVGVAPTDLEVSKFMAELNAYPLLRDVWLEYSEQKEIDAIVMRQFKIRMLLDPDADVRQVDPLTIPRIKNPMTDQLQTFPSSGSSAGVSGRTGKEGR